MRKNIFTKIAAVAAATVLAVTVFPALVSYTHAADDEYSYVYAGLTWQEYWANEGVYNAGDVTSSNEKDTHGEYDKGGFDTVTRATTNHGLHRGSYQCMATIDTEDGKKYELAGWSSDGKQMILTDGTQLSYNKGIITKADGTTTKLVSYEVTGIKYVPVRLRHLILLILSSITELSRMEKSYTVDSVRTSLAHMSIQQQLMQILTDLRQQLRMQMEHIHSLQDRLEVESHLQSRI